MNLPKKEELLKEVVAVVEGSYEAAKEELEKKAKSLKEEYYREVERVCASVSL
ncbi:MAG: hypothetical protein GXO07_03870 [Crenarchaeota archaeon]|nr:hypothetical protein [Thermoproteota archaeon]